MSSRVTVTYKNPGTIHAIPVITPRRVVEVSDDVVDDSGSSTSDSVVPSRRKGRPRQKAKARRAAEAAE